jgi:hypothetical protein
LPEVSRVADRALAGACARNGDDGSPSMWRCVEHRARPDPVRTACARVAAVALTGLWARG